MTELIFDKYESIRRLAIGGMGEIFLARQQSVGGFDRFVILKSLLPDFAKEDRFVNQFLDEARLVASLNHPNIVAIYEVGLWRGTYFIAMEYIRGHDVSRLMKDAAAKRERIPWRVAAQIVCDASMGISHAHEACDTHGERLNIVHRDISPQNIMIRHDGVCKLVDFGIAKAAQRLERTATGLIKGKLSYMSPEQIRGGSIDALSDQFSLGIVLWELSVGKRLFEGDTPPMIMKKIQGASIPVPSSQVEGFPEDLAATITKMLERDPAKRFPNCQAVANALRKLVERQGDDIAITQVASFVTETSGEVPNPSTEEPGSDRPDFLISLGTPSDSSQGPAPANEHGEATVPLSPAKRAPMQSSNEKQTGVRPFWRRALIPAVVGFAISAGGLVAWRAGMPGQTTQELVSAQRSLTNQVDSERAPSQTLAPGILTLKSTPKNASIWLGDEKLGNTPLRIDRLAPNKEHALVLKRRGYKDRSMLVTLPAGTDREIEVVLRRGRAEKRSKAKQDGAAAVRPSSIVTKTATDTTPGILKLKTSPWAQATIDGEPYGATPLRVMLPPGKHTLRLLRPELDIDTTRQIDIKPNRTSKVILTLTGQEAP